MHEGRRENKFAVHVRYFRFFIFCSENYSVLIVLPSRYFSTYVPQQVVYHIVERTVVFPVDISPRPAIGRRLTDIFTSRSIIFQCVAAESGLQSLGEQCQ